jgi:hypothetical protein
MDVARPVIKVPRQGDIDMGVPMPSHGHQGHVPQQNQYLDAHIDALNSSVQPTFSFNKETTGMHVSLQKIVRAE